MKKEWKNYKGNTIINLKTTGSPIKLLLQWLTGDPVVCKWFWSTNKDRKSKIKKKNPKNPNWGEATSCRNI